MAYIDAAEKYLKLKKIGKGYFALCPFHEESTPSFSFDANTGLYHCFGCDEKGDVFTLIEKMENVNFPKAVEIAKEYGIEPPASYKELRPKEQAGDIIEGNPQKTPVAEKTVKDLREAENQVRPVKKKTAVYVYTDESGKILFEKERWETFENGKKIDKNFLFYHYEGVKRIAGKGNAKQYLYKIEEIIKPNIEIIGICEGEKDVDNLYNTVSIKNAAWTTNSAGALHWEEDFNQYFKNKTVLIFEDNDEAGRQRTERLLNSIGDTAKEIITIRFTELNKHGDLSDYIELNGAKALTQKILSEISKKDFKVAKVETEINKETTIETPSGDLKTVSVFDLRFYKEKKEYLNTDLFPLKQNDTNTILNSNIELLALIALESTRKFNVAFLSNFKEDDVFVFFKNIINRTKGRNYKDFKFGKKNAKIDENVELIISTDFTIIENATVICPSGKNIPDYIYKDGIIYDKFGKALISIENLKGSGNISIVKVGEEKRQKQKLGLSNIFKRQ